VIQLILLPNGLMIFRCPDERTKAAIVEAFAPSMARGSVLPSNCLLIVTDKPIDVEDFRDVGEPQADV